MDEISKSKQFRGLTPQCRDPMQQCKSTPRRGMSKPWCSREGGLDKPRVRRGVVRRSKATPRRRPTPWHNIVHRHVFLSRFAIPLFRGLIYWTNEDPISV